MGELGGGGNPNTDFINATFVNAINSNSIHNGGRYSYTFDHTQYIYWVRVDGYGTSDFYFDKDNTLIQVYTEETYPVQFTQTGDTVEWYQPINAYTYVHIYRYSKN